MALRGRVRGPARLHSIRRYPMLVALHHAVPGAMSIDHNTVRHIARLARLAVDDAQLAPLAAELQRVLQLADELGAADIAGVAPMAHPHDQTLAWRDDVVTESDRAEAFLALAPEANGGLYLVPKVIE